MRISDWCSDVGSSDLADIKVGHVAPVLPLGIVQAMLLVDGVPVVARAFECRGIAAPGHMNMGTVLARRHAFDPQGERDTARSLSHGCASCCGSLCGLQQGDRRARFAAGGSHSSKNGSATV